MRGLTPQHTQNDLSKNERGLLHTQDRFISCLQANLFIESQSLSRGLHIVASLESGKLRLGLWWRRNRKIKNSDEHSRNCKTTVNERRALDESCPATGISKLLSKEETAPTLEPASVSRWFKFHPLKLSLPSCCRSNLTYTHKQRDSWWHGSALVCVSSYTDHLLKFSPFSVYNYWLKTQLSSQRKYDDLFWSQIWAITAQEIGFHYSKCHVPIWKQMKEIFITFQIH